MRSLGFPLNCILEGAEMFSDSGKFSFSFIIENNLNKLHKCLT